MYKYALFDLDGTLTDPSLGITNSIMHALEKMGRDIPPREELYCFIGPPLVTAFQEFLGLTAEEAEQAVVFYREYFSVNGLFENTPYEGIAELLAKLKERGVTLAVATSKPEKFAVRIIEHFGLAEYFTLVCGASMDSSRSKKGDVIAYTLGHLGVTEADKSSVLMIGDRHHDIEGAKENGLASAGVLWGFGDEDELKTAGADAIAHDMDELAKIVTE